MGSPSGEERMEVMREVIEAGKVYTTPDGVEVYSVHTVSQHGTVKGIKSVRTPSGIWTADFICQRFFLQDMVRLGRLLPQPD